MTEDPNVHDLEKRLRTSLSHRAQDPGSTATARIAQRLGLPPRRRRHRALTFAVIVLVVILTSLVWLGSLITARPSPGGSDTAPSAVTRQAFEGIERT